LSQEALDRVLILNDLALLSLESKEQGARPFFDEMLALLAQSFTSPPTPLLEPEHLAELVRPVLPPPILLLESEYFAKQEQVAKEGFR
jgi:hypothetical protein